MNLSRIFPLPVLLILLLFFSGCANQTRVGTLRGAYDNTPPVDLSNTPLVKKTLYQQLRQWEGTEYKYGGLGGNGVDCSGFIYLTFKSRFGIQLPRSTDEQIEVGQDVTERQLLPGDLVFFSTGFFDRHVGIYLENKNFIHVSKNRGVMLSNLDDQYWHSRYRKAKRIRQEWQTRLYSQNRYP